MRSKQDAELQLKTAHAFISMAGNEKYPEPDRKRYFLMAYMHAKVASVIAGCLDLIQFEFEAGNVASDCHLTLEKMLDGAGIDEALEEYPKIQARRKANDTTLGLLRDLLISKDQR